MQVSFVMRLMRHVVSVRADIYVGMSFWLMMVMVHGVCALVAVDSVRVIVWWIGSDLQ